MDIETLTPRQWIENEEAYTKLLEDQNIRDKIPFLNVNKTEHFKNLSLVKFYGMVQDMDSPEYYLEKFEVINKITKQSTYVTGKYNENITVEDNEYVNFENSSNITSERQTFVVISVPAINSWVHTLDGKFRLDVTKNMQTEFSSNKRAYEETMDVEAGPSNVEKKVCSEVSKAPYTKSTSSNPKDIFPFPKEGEQVFHIKLYTNQDKLKINDVCEFVGFLDTFPTLIPEVCDAQMDTDALNAPASLYPRIHCVNYKKMKHNNPLLEEDTKIENIDVLRKDLLVVLTQLLLGDELAAEYLLYHLISQVYLRRDGLALGKFSLNISNIPSLPSYPIGLYKFIEKLLPKSIYLPMTLENLNDLTFVPKKNYELNYLSSGVLQLSNNTHVVLDETKLSPGKLNEAGLSNIKALSSCIKNQSLHYDFKFYPLEFDCDIPFLILSEGKSMIPSDVHVILQPDEMCLNNFKEIVEAADHFLKPDLLNNIRKYLTSVRLIDYSLSEEIETFIQDEFVKMRQDKNATIDDLHGMLILARLVSISEGKKTLGESAWKKASEIEETRKIRIKN